MNTRTEADSIGTLEVPVDAYYGVQSLRGKLNFPITGHPMHDKLIVSLAQIKKASAIANKHAGTLDAKIADAIPVPVAERARPNLVNDFFPRIHGGSSFVSAGFTPKRFI